MSDHNIFSALEALGKVMVNLGTDQEHNNHDWGITEEEHLKLLTTINKQFQYNGWFTKEAVKESLKNLGALLKAEDLKNWKLKYTCKSENKRVAIIMAGNIPLVGFHDFLSVLVSGNIAVCKLSSDDKTLLPALCEILIRFEPSLKDRFEFSFGKLENIDAVIATGSNNSAQYFEKYFGKYPNIIRKGRTSVAVITGQETEEELKALGKDIFQYFGLGCRNVTQLLIPSDFDINRFFAGIVDYGDVINHHKYANNYDYYKAIYLMNQEQLLENGFLLTKESDELFSPIAVLYWHKYHTEDEVNGYLDKHKEQIQAIVGKDYIPFGKAQTPSLTDYADNIDTLNFLAKMD